MNPTRFSCACAAALALTGFTHRLLRMRGGSPGGGLDAAFVGLILLIYGGAVLWGARRVVRMTPEQAQDELLRVAAVGFVLAAMALEMP